MNYYNSYNGWSYILGFHETVTSKRIAQTGTQFHAQSYFDRRTCSWPSTSPTLNKAYRRHQTTFYHSWTMLLRVETFGTENERTNGQPNLQFAFPRKLPTWWNKNWVVFCPAGPTNSIHRQFVHLSFDQIWKMPSCSKICLRELVVVYDHERFEFSSYYVSHQRPV